MIKKMKFGAFFFMFFLILSISSNGQFNQANPANWLFPNGNMNGTRYQPFASDKQEIDSFKIKWAVDEIYGDIQPLSGNIINNPKIFQSFPYSPNEIAAVVAGKIVVIDGIGKVHKLNTHEIPFIKNISVLFDSLQTGLSSNIKNPVIMGLETIEFENQRDSLAYTYLAGFDETADSAAILKRLAIDLRPFKPNIYASIKPVFGKRDGSNLLIYAAVNISNPVIDTQKKASVPFFRGFTQFNTGIILYNFPLPDVGDNPAKRLTVAPEVHFSQPSFTFEPAGSKKSSILLPSFPSYKVNANVYNPISGFDTTNTQKPYFIGLDIGTSDIKQNIGPYDLTNLLVSGGIRPQIRPIFTDIKDAGSTDSAFVILAEEYRGLDSSFGTSRLYLFDNLGNIITDPRTTGNPPFSGYKNHEWSIAVGNVDGKGTNSWLPFFPNNPGKEIIVTHSSKNLSVAGSKLMILRYRSGTKIPKPSPPDTYLNPFDTIVTQNMNGWVAAVNDLDGNDDKKDEIVIVDGQYLRILKLRDYSDFDFRIGNPFDTVYSIRFPDETITDAIVTDIEGDGLNDIAVTTFRRTYLLGNVIGGGIRVISPSTSDGPQLNFCPGEDITVKWNNKFNNYGGVDIFFHALKDSLNKDTLVTIATNFANKGDTVKFELKAPKFLMGRHGRFIVSNNQEPRKISDSSSIIFIKKQEIYLQNLSKSFYRAGEDITFSGNTSCTDSVQIDYSYDSKYWIKSTIAKVQANGNFSAGITIPCPQFYDCNGQDLDSTVKFRFIGINNELRDTSVIFGIKVLPEVFPLEFDTSLASCPEKEFKWDINKIYNPCDTVNISISTDEGISFKEIGRVALKDEKFLWKVQLNLPDMIILRFCCENSCVRSDSVLINYKPQNLGIVMPNPFNPYREVLEIIYKVTEETNVTIKILDQNNRLVSTPVTSESRTPGIAYCDRWQGNLSDGSYVANGLYYVVLEYSNGQKEVYPVFVRK